MKKRVFVPISIGFLLLDLFFWGLSILCLVTFIIELVNGSPNIEWNFFEYAIMVFAIIFLFFTAIRFLLCFKIHLRKTDIITYGDGLPKFEKIQYKCIVKYKDIQSISIVASEKNSKNQSIQLIGVSSSMPKKYLVFTLINSKRKKRMCINYYNKKQIIKMLNYINENMQEVGNENKLDINKIIQDWYIYGGYNREELKIKRGEKIRKKSKTKKQNENLDNELNENAEK